jgi:glycosyltransferase involved in cell wall biosynthesis
MLYLYSPLPPAKSGPADYLATLLENVEREAGAGIKDSLTLLYEASVAPRPDKLHDMGWNIRDYKGLLPRAKDVCVYFLASNPHHYFIYDALHRHQLGKSIAVVHDLAAGFYVREMSGFAKSSVGKDGLLRAFKFDFGHRAAAVLANYDVIHPTARFFIMAHGLTVEGTERIYVHSHYAKTRLVFESAIDVPFEKVRVAKFPRRPMDPQSMEGSENFGKFRVSMLGFYHESKRYPSVLTAWREFARKLPGTDSMPIELIVGGELADDVRRSLESLFENEPGSDSVQFVGYVSEEDLDDYILTSSLVVNLRFPSWGETSAMVHRVVELGRPIAVSAFAGYHEETAVKRISVDPIDEVDELIDLFEEAYAQWRNGGRLVNVDPPEFGPKLDLEREIIALAAG